MKGIVFVTGGAGFIGSNIVNSLTAEGVQVVVSDWLGAGSKWRNLCQAGLFDVIRPEAAAAWLKSTPLDISAVVHMGAISATTEIDVDKIVECNVRSSFDLWDAAVRRSVPFIYASSAAVYGDGAHGFVDHDNREQIDKLQPLNAYGWSKLVVDKRILSDIAHRRETPPQWAGIRFFNVYGPGEDHKGEMRSVINKLLPDAQAGTTVRLFKSHRSNYQDGEQLRDFVHVEDCVALVRWLMANPSVSGIFNCGTGHARSFKDLAIAVFRACGREPSIDYIDVPANIRNAYQYYTEADLRRLRSAGFDRRFLSLEDGIAAYVRSRRADRGSETQ